MTQSQTAGMPLPWDEKGAKSSPALTPEFPNEVCHPVYSSHLCLQHISSSLPHGQPQAQSPKSPIGKTSQISKDKDVAEPHWLPASCRASALLQPVQPVHLSSFTHHWWTAKALSSDALGKERKDVPTPHKPGPTAASRENTIMETAEGL